MAFELPIRILISPVKNGALSASTSLLFHDWIVKEDKVLLLGNGNEASVKETNEPISFQITFVILTTYLSSSKNNTVKNERNKNEPREYVSSISLPKFPTYFAKQNEIEMHESKPQNEMEQNKKASSKEPRFVGPNAENVETQYEFDLDSLGIQMNVEDHFIDVEVNNRS